MSNTVNIFSILTLVAILIVFIAQIIALSTDYWSETKVLNSTITVSFDSETVRCSSVGEGTMLTMLKFKTQCYVRLERSRTLRSAQVSDVGVNLRNPLIRDM